MATTFEKTWQFIVNKPILTTYNKWQYWAIKSGLKGEFTFKDNLGVDIGSPSGLWTIISSCDGSSVSASDLWGTTYSDSKIVVAAEGSTHSWMQLYNSSLGLYLVINCTGGYETLVFSTTEFTGGSTTYRPTAVNEAKVHWANQGTAGNFNLLMTTEGSFIVFATYTSSSAIRGAAMCLKLADTQAGELYPFFFQGINVDWGWSSDNLLANTYAGKAFHPRLGIPCDACFMGMSYTDSMNSRNALDYVALDPVDDGANDLPIFVFSRSLPNSIRGRVPDIYWGSNLNAIGTVEPPTGQVLSMLIQSLWIPAYTSLVF